MYGMAPRHPPSGKDLKAINANASKERRRERNKVLARKTRVKKKAELETLRDQVAALKAENDRLRGTVRSGTASASGSGSGSGSSHMLPFSSKVLAECDFKLPEHVTAVVDKLLLSAGNDAEGSRSFCISNPTAPDCPIVYCSPGFVQLTGYDMHSILGHNCRFLQGPETDQNEVKKLETACAEGREETVVIKNYRKDGSCFWNRVQISPIRDSNHKVAFIVGLQIEVSGPRPSGTFITALSSHRTGVSMAKDRRIFTHHTQWAGADGGTEEESAAHPYDSNTGQANAHYPTNTNGHARGDPPTSYRMPLPQYPTITRPDSPNSCNGSLKSDQSDQSEQSDTSNDKSTRSAHTSFADDRSVGASSASLSTHSQYRQSSSDDTDRSDGDDGDGDGDLST
jgi:PAS domain S-box-containing protein